MEEGKKEDSISNHASTNEEALIGDKLQKLRSTLGMLRKTSLKSLMQAKYNSNNIVYKEVDATKIDANDRQEFINRAIKVPGEDNDKFLRKIRNRMNR